MNKWIKQEGLNRNSIDYSVWESVIDSTNTLVWNSVIDSVYYSVIRSVDNTSQDKIEAEFKLL